MRINLPTFIALAFFFALPFVAYVSAQTESAKTSEQNSDKSKQDILSWEIKPGDIKPEFSQRWDYEFKRPAQELQQDVTKQIRIIYLVPSDRAIRDDYKAAATDAILHLQDFYQKELGNNNAFSLHSPIVEVYQTAHTASWYSTNPSRPNAAQNIWFWENALNDGFSLTGGSFNDPNNRWVYYIDADPACGQVIGGNAGVAVLAANDFRGLTGGQNIPGCSTEQPDRSGKYRWIGGLGHELGHTFNLPHPSGCDQGNCQGGQTAYLSLMYVGYAAYTNTYFLSQDTQTLLNSGFYSPMDLRLPRSYDFDNDRVADYSVWRPNTGVWYNLRSSDGNSTVVAFGLNGDKVVPGDYDGDRKTDIGVWRPSDGIWYILRSSDNTYSYIPFGSNGDIPVAADYDGDRITDVAVWRPSSGVWYIQKSATNTSLVISYGVNGDKPVPADYNGDKRADLAVFRPSANTWYVYNQYLSYYYANPQTNQTVIVYGANNDKLIPADYDGDNKADVAVWRPSSGVWYYIGSATNTSQIASYGLNGDIPVSADYDNDGKTDLAVWRPSSGVFYVLKSSTNSSQAFAWGLDGDIPVASAFVR